MKIIRLLLIILLLAVSSCQSAPAVPASIPTRTAAVRTSTSTPAGVFSGLMADLAGYGSAAFSFAFSGSSFVYSVDVASSPNMLDNLYVGFAEGTSSPLVVDNPEKWNKFACGSIFYWQVTASSGEKSTPLAATVSCTSPGDDRLVTSSYERKVFLLIFNPWLPSREQTLIDYTHSIAPLDLAREYSEFLNTASRGRLNYVIVDSQEVNDTIWFTMSDGFTYDETSYLDMIDNGSAPHGTVESGLNGLVPQDEPIYADYSLFLDDPKLDICGKVNQAEIDELWVFSGPGYGLFESRLIGPNAFYYNSPPYEGTICNRMIPIMGFNYDSNLGIQYMVENFIHRSEATMQYIYTAPDGFDLANNTSSEVPLPGNNWDRFWLNDFVYPPAGYSGCGWAHFPPNGTLGNGVGYDWNNPNPHDSNCDDFYNYPNLSIPQTMLKPVTCLDWGCTGIGFFGYWLDHIPTFKGRGPDGIANDWWPYIIDPNLAVSVAKAWIPVGTSSPEYASVRIESAVQLPIENGGGTRIQLTGFSSATDATAITFIMVEDQAFNCRTIAEEPGSLYCFGPDLPRSVAMIKIFDPAKPNTLVWEGFATILE